MALFWGFNPPLFPPGGGVWSQQEDDRLVKNDILSLLLTSPGERIHRSAMGTLLVAAIMEPMNEQNVSELKSSIFNALVEYEGERLRDIQVYVTPIREKHQLEVTVSATLIRDRSPFSMTTTLNLGTS